MRRHIDCLRTQPLELFMLLASRAASTHLKGRLHRLISKELVLIGTYPSWLWSKVETSSEPELIVS